MTVSLIDLIEKAAALAGKLGKKDLQEKLLQLAKEAKEYESNPYVIPGENPVERPKLNGKETRHAIATALADAFGDDRFTRNKEREDIARGQ